ncbi:cobalamin biosynthesis protein CobD [Desulfosarcina widdelii]|uniref:Cobalamin biosynthesis protein CobD n=1 Tax=Desulfosarcina widdelii TaxID=947919 RepID=A0A5K7Z1E4_9BACT|nr:adenosylcobinamide-phosphate synthase CbiB [Desulfosarcina widdelii]BBO74480.1 cobalamin biosynthesis protein CobD [Desulfosarcina widdelii]
MGTEALVLALTVAVVLDLLLGDPLWLPHPVRWMGKAINVLEPRFRRLNLSVLYSGALMAAGLVLAVWIGCLLLVALAAKLHPVAAVVVQTLMIYTCISARDLRDAALAVAKALSEKGLAAGRRAVSMIVGRETDRLDETAVTRAAVETVAENLVDGFVSPLFFFVLGGGPLAMAYKMINTLDSMIGYKNDRYLLFGRFAARLDDVANYLPARISPLFIALTAQSIDRTGRIALSTAWRDGRAHASPNAGYPEAAFAGALGLWMGGPNFYHGRLVDKPVIGKGLADARPVHIRRACRLMLATAMLVFMAAAVAVLLLAGFC